MNRLNRSARFALAAVLLCGAALPALLPLDPAGRLLSCGLLPVFLLAGCYLPAREGFARASRRELACSMGFSLILAASLCVGTELRLHDGLLPGLPALLRRLLVPLAATPLLGALAARLLCARPSVAEKRRPFPRFGFSAILLCCWLPVLLAYFPAMLNYDVISEYNQHLTGQYSSLNPLLSSLILNGVVTLGETLHSRSFGLLLMSLLQMGALSLALGHACAFAQRRGAPRWALALMTAYFALHPVFSAMAISMTKDTLFAAAVVALSLECFAFLESPAAFLARRARVVGFVLLATLTALLRSNGPFALLLLLPGMIVASRGARRQAAALAAACALAPMLLLGGIHAALRPLSMPSFQFFSLPAQQLVRASHSDAMSEADKEELRSYYLSEEGLVVHPHIADAAKGYLDPDKLSAESGAFLSLWARNLLPCAKEYAEAFLMLNVGSWYPDDLSHSTIYPDYTWSDMGYLQTQEYDLEDMGFETRCFLPRLRALYERVCRRNRYQRYPVLPLLFCPATPFLAMLFACFVLVARRRARLIPAALGALGLWLSYLLGPCTLPRYALPLFALAPALLTVSLCAGPVQRPAEERRFDRIANMAAAAGALGLLVAAPYLTPAGPDSPVFLSAAMPVLLVAGGFFRLRRSFGRISARRMALALLAGLAAALCLALHAEFAVYGRLLPGLGSLARRIAVPIFAAPYLGVLLTQIKEA